MFMNRASMINKNLEKQEKDKIELNNEEEPNQ